MNSRFEKHRLPWATEKVFDMVADIERYHEFLPLWTHARITRREGDVLLVRQGIELGMMRLDFESRAQLQRPERLQVESSGGPFRSLQIDWQFVPESDDSCRVTLEVAVEMRTLLLEAASGRFLDLMTKDTFRRFRKRAEFLYGG